MFMPLTIITQPNNDTMETTLPSPKTIGHFSVPIITTRPSAWYPRIVTNPISIGHAYNQNPCLRWNRIAPAGEIISVWSIIGPCFATLRLQDSGETPQFAEWECPIARSAPESFRLNRSPPPGEYPIAHQVEFLKTRARRRCCWCLRER